MPLTVPLISVGRFSALNRDVTSTLVRIGLTSRFGPFTIRRRAVPAGRASALRQNPFATFATLMFAGAHAISAQNSTKPTLPISGPQGIGIRVEPIPADAPRFEAASIRRDQSGTMPPSSQGQMVFFRGNRLTATTITV